MTIYTPSSPEWREFGLPDTAMSLAVMEGVANDWIVCIELSGQPSLVGSTHTLARIKVQGGWQGNPLPDVRTIKATAARLLTGLST